MARDVAAAIEALEEYDVWYETTAMGTVIETESLDELLSAVAAAHRTVDADRVSTFLKIDDERRGGGAREKVKSVEEELGRPPKSDSE